MTDIVERLREHHQTGMAGLAHADVVEAADEIERLRKENVRLRIRLDSRPEVVVIGEAP